MLAMTVAAYLTLGLTASLSCDGVVGDPSSPAVDFETEIVPALNACASCHGGGYPAGELALDPPSLDALACVPAMAGPRLDLWRVEPFLPDRSALFLRLDCDDAAYPQWRMPPYSAGDSVLSTLVADWIAQGATPSADYIQYRGGFEVCR